MHSSTVRACLCCPTETSRPDRRAATAGTAVFCTSLPASVEHHNGHVNILDTRATRAIPACIDVSATNASNRAEQQDHGETSAILAHTPHPHTSAHGTAHEHQNHEETSAILAYIRVSAHECTAVNTSTRTTKTSTILAHIDVSAHHRAHLKHTRKRKILMSSPSKSTVSCAPHTAAPDQ